MDLYLMTTQPINITPVTMRPSSHVLEASIKIQKEILFCKQTGLYILHFSED